LDPEEPYRGYEPGRSYGPVAEKHEEHAKQRGVPGFDEWLICRQRLKNSVVKKYPVAKQFHEPIP
jgi:hypothetical protein